MQAMLVGALNRTGENRPMAALQVSDGIWPGGWQRMAATRLQSGERGTTVLAQKYSSAKPGAIPASTGPTANAVSAAGSPALGELIRAA